MIYYYCTNATFLSIVKHRSLWLSDMTQSNDSYEIHRYVEIVVNALKSEAEALTGHEKHRRPPWTAERLEDLKSVYTNAAKALSKQEDEYYCLAICFSDMGNNLSQWRGYGDDGHGISVGFDEDRIEELSTQHALFKYDDVRYYSSLEDSDIREKLKCYIEELQEICVSTRRGQRIRTDAIKKWCTNVLDDDAPFVKPAGFIDERETRFCYVRYISPFEMQKPKENSHLLDVDFHASGNALVPHYELKLNDKTGVFIPDVIREVTLGPCNGSQPKAVMTLLAKYGFDIGKIKVKKSDLSYRSRK